MSKYTKSARPPFRDGGTKALGILQGCQVQFIADQLQFNLRGVVHRVIPWIRNTNRVRPLSGSPFASRRNGVTQKDCLAPRVRGAADVGI